MLDAFNKANIKHKMSEMKTIKQTDTTASGLLMFCNSCSLTQTFALTMNSLKHAHHLIFSKIRSFQNLI